MSLFRPGAADGEEQSARGDAQATMTQSSAFTIEVPGSGMVSALLARSAHPTACFVLAHGAGAGMKHKFLEAVASGLAARNIATLRYQFPYMEHGARRPDTPAVAQATIRAAVVAAAAKAPDLPLIAGGKSLG